MSQGAVYSRHAPTAHRLAFLLTGDRELAKDLTHEAFIRMWGRFQSFRDDRSLRAYMRQTIVNLVRGYYRRRRIETLYLSRQVEPEASLQPDIEAQDQLWRALTSLPPRQRIAVVLRYYEDLTERQAADLLGCSVSAVKSLTARALNTLRDQLEGSHDE